MNHRSATAVASIGVAAAVLCGAPACAHAEPEPRPVTTPQPDTPCSENLAGTMARLADGKNLACTGQADGFRWTVSTSPYPLSDRWLTYGPELQLHGQGMRNPEIMSGLWTGYPQVSDGVCRAEQVAVVGAGKVSLPESVTGEPGKQLEFSVSPTLFTIKLSGNCLWQKV
jgi:hypothetical protein